MKQTAVEYLQQHFKTLIQEDKKGLYKLLFEQAKEMEKEQIKNSYHSGAIDGFNFRTTSIYPNSEKYYNETFKSE